MIDENEYENPAYMNLVNASSSREKVDGLLKAVFFVTKHAKNPQQLNVRNKFFAELTEKHGLSRKDYLRVLDEYTVIQESFKECFEYSIPLYKKNSVQLVGDITHVTQHDSQRKIPVTDNFTSLMMNNVLNAIKNN